MHRDHEDQQFVCADLPFIITLKSCFCCRREGERENKLLGEGASDRLENAMQFVDTTDAPSGYPWLSSSVKYVKMSSRFELKIYILNHPDNRDSPRERKGNFYKMKKNSSSRLAMNSYIHSETRTKREEDMEVWAKKTKSGKNN